ncbi:phytanoyl-CoA dioxygenase family protein [Pseudomonas subflava]|uniref:phytanoyl-CoA dioxygenase family protein n=1 Tax=Pseudomonas subflava TaxID=2952933 RepID=UPI00207A2906|nr:phytanoyl-CoA dioxygenase family protein [Pseudomonas subflava]
MMQNSQNPISLSPIRESSALLGDPGALRARFEEEGYLYLKGLLPKAKVQVLQAQIFDICKRKHWFSGDAASFESVEPCVVPAVEGEVEYFSVYDEVQRLEAFHALPHEPALMAVMGILLDETAFPHPLSICRLMFPNNAETTTPPHQDFPNNQGTTELYACWMPLSDCPVNLGGLAFMPGSHKHGLLPLQFSLGAGNRQAVLPDALQEKPWVTGDYQQGDVLIFHSLMLHRALDNQTNRMRVSVDYRYQSVRDPLTVGCLKPHFQRESWTRIYEGWASSQLQFYWEKLPLKFVEWTDKYHQLPEGHLEAALGQTIRYNKRRAKLAEQLKTGDAPD